VLTYVYSKWGNSGKEVLPETVKEVRATSLPASAATGASATPSTPAAPAAAPAKTTTGAD
jgi:hypothetical protein